MARYDYGLRGPRDTMGPRVGRGNPRYSAEFDRRSGGSPRPYRVTRRYNMDYVRPGGERYPVNYNRFGGEWPEQIGNEEIYRTPYRTMAGTRTSRGVPPPIRYDYPDYGPGYGGRYPDEL